MEMKKDKIKALSAKKLKLSAKLIDENALQVIKILQRHKFQAFIVGGAVRDLLLQQKPKDFDIVTNAHPEQVRKIFRNNSLIIGKRFKIVHVYFKVLNETRSKKYHKNIYDRQIIEVSTFRANIVDKNNLSVHGKVIFDNNYGTLLDDSYRRDFTINALYYDPIANVIVDQQNGLQDVTNKQLKMIGNVHLRYIEDPLRLIRAIRLSVKLGLSIEQNTLIGFQKAKNLLVHEPKARLFEESLKILMSSNVSQIISDIYELGIPDHVFPLFSLLKDSIQTSDSFENYIFARMQDRIKNNEDVSISFLLAALLWNKAYELWVKYSNNKKQNDAETLKSACQDLEIKLTKKIGIPISIYRHIESLYMFQLHFSSLNRQQIHDIVNNKKFRQAWHLYNMRQSFYNPNSKKLQWWAEYIDSEEDKREKLLKSPIAQAILIEK
jgi:poly(A) polymerase